MTPPPRCRKVRFRDRIAALIAALIALADSARRSSAGNPRRREVRAYRCPDCHGWHLTSQERAR